MASGMNGRDGTLGESLLRADTSRATNLGIGLGLREPCSGHQGSWQGWGAQTKGKPWGFPGGTVVKNLPANAGDTGSSPGLGRSHMPRSNWAREPQLLSLHIWSLCSATGEAAIVRGPRTAMKSGPLSPQLEKALAQKRRPNRAINK